MLIASKYEEMCAPEISDFVYITNRTYKESQIRDMEIKILSPPVDHRKNSEPKNICFDQYMHKNM